MSVKEKIRTVPDFPKPGIQFRDITTLLQDAEGLQEIINILYERYKNAGIQKIVGIEARGFILGAALAYKMKLGFVPVRKKGKLPFETYSYEYDLEYGSDVIEIHKDAITAGEKVLLVDDLLATGGTSMAAAELIKRIGAEIFELAFIVDLPDVGGRKSLEAKGLKYFAICEFEGD
ncbi:MAG: adenine phosphoribosyltransferase [Spirochaetes bacterium]|nr:adenine phosphoribosyltransferase [Spirochaetota bacterium]